jgi:hypothetical protein
VGNPCIYRLFQDAECGMVAAVRTKVVLSMNLAIISILARTEESGLPLSVRMASYDGKNALENTCHFTF